MLPIDHFPECSPAGFKDDIPDDAPASIDSPLFEIDPEPEGWQPKGAVTGDRVHAVLEKIDFQNPDKWFRSNENLLRKIYRDNYDEVKVLSMNFFSMELPFDLKKSEVLGREYSYIVRTSAGMKKRYVDLLLSDSGKLTIVDYKTDSFGGSSVAEAAEPYLETQRHYIEDISGIFGLQACGYLVFLREGTVYPVELE